MNILIIGNGFDLAHGLPTKYEHFLKFMYSFIEYKTAKEEGKELGWNDGEDVSYYRYFINLFNRKYDDKLAGKIIEELSELASNNVWIKYFTAIYESRKQAGKDGWIDFESEISSVIQALDSACKTIREQLQQGNDKAKMEQWQLNILSPFISKDGVTLKMESCFFELKAVDYRKQQFLNDLNRLIRGLEIYLSDYGEKYYVENRLPDIQKLPYLDKVLSFNYTDTYERLYGKHPFLEIDYIHGKALLNNSTESNSMVLGIDEYLKGDARNEDIEFIEFKKYFQRIHKETGCLYEEWIEDIQSEKAAFEITRIYEENGSNKKQSQQVMSHKLFIFGHSLDITDRDILRKFILNDNMQTTIFYKDRADYGRKIANLVRIINQDELIKRTGGKTKTITFKEITKGE